MLEISIVAIATLTTYRGSVNARVWLTAARLAIVPC